MPKWNHVDPRACIAPTEWLNSLDVHAADTQLYENTDSGYGLGLYLISDEEKVGESSDIDTDIKASEEDSKDVKIKFETCVHVSNASTIAEIKSTDMKIDIGVKVENSTPNLHCESTRARLTVKSEDCVSDDKCIRDNSYMKEMISYQLSTKVEPSESHVQNSSDLVIGAVSDANDTSVRPKSEVKAEDGITHIQNSKNGKTSGLHSSTTKGEATTTCLVAEIKSEPRMTEKSYSTKGDHADIKPKSEVDADIQTNTESRSSFSQSKSHTSQVKAENSQNTTENRLAMPLYYVSPAVAADRSTTWGPMEAGWYVIAPPESHFEIRVSPLLGSLSKKRCAEAYDDLLVWVYVDGAVCNVEGNVATKRSDIVYQGIKQIADGDTTVVSKFVFQSAKLTEDAAADMKCESGGNNENVGTIKLVFKGAHRGQHEPLAYEKYQNNRHSARAKVSEKEAIKRGKSLGVGKGAAMKVKRSKHADFDYPEHLQTELMGHEITIRIRELFWMESRRLVDSAGEACTHSSSGRDVDMESALKKQKLEHDFRFDLGIKGEDGIIDLC